TFKENVLGRLFATHSNGLEALEFFKFTLDFPNFIRSPDAFEKTLHILTRMRNFDKAWELIENIHKTHPSLLTPKSMSIMLSKIAKVQSFDETLEAFDKLELKLSQGNPFGTEEFNLLLRAFCTHRQMREARSVFNRLYSRFTPTTKTSNILLLGFKESGDVTSVELFYHSMIRRGFSPDTIMYNIKIDSYSKQGSFEDGLHFLNEMEHMNCFPTLRTVRNLIYGAGVSHNTREALELFNEIRDRNLVPDSGVYNVLIKAYIRSGNVMSATRVMNEMEESNILPDHFTFHMMFSGLINSSGIIGVLPLYYQMIGKNYVPKIAIVVMLMTFLLQNREVNEALGFLRDLWKTWSVYGTVVDVFILSKTSKADDTSLVDRDLSNHAMGKVKDFSSIPKLYTILNDKGFSDVMLSYLGGLWALFEFNKMATKVYGANIVTLDKNCTGQWRV
nr:pentatricopeptide repeat-containing protein At3g61360 [Tanacetum cinerariifolium]